jgi:hypothetical protein
MNLKWTWTGVPLAIVAGWVALAQIHYYNVIYPTPFEVPAKTEGAVPESRTAIAQTLAILIDQMLEPEWQPNDLAFYPTAAPGIGIDNTRNFQYGMLMAIRDVLISMRDHVSRVRTNSEMDTHIVNAYNLMANDSDKWWMPVAEWEYAKARDEIMLYVSEVEAGRAVLTPRADSAIALIQRLASRLGDESRQLELAILANSDMMILSSETAGDANLEGEREVPIDVSWFSVDDRFYHAQGAMYVVYHVMQALMEDFKPTIETKRSSEFGLRVLHAVHPNMFMHDPWPVVMNGDLFGPWPNHPSQLLSMSQNGLQYLENFGQALAD